MGNLLLRLGFLVDLECVDKSHYLQQFYFDLRSQHSDVCVAEMEIWPQVCLEF